jgi:hypothetical protein
MQNQLLRRLRQLVIERALETGGWPYSMRGLQRATEPTALAILACSNRADILARTQNADGGWAPVYLGGATRLPSGWSTSLATIAQLWADPAESGVPRALQWLCADRGIESHWLWRWKFKLADTQVAFNPDKFGWSWVPETASWVIPTAFAVIALRMALRRGLIGPEAETRVRIGSEMLLNRACPAGGWNAGNSRVFGVALEAHTDATAIALLALQGCEPNGILITQSLAQLIGRTRGCSGVFSLAWALLALHAWRRHQGIPWELAMRCKELERLMRSPERIADNATLAVCALALDALANDRNPFEVVP